MTSAKETLPSAPYTMGDTFSYAAWTAGTTITLCNVPWNSDYRDIVYFTDQSILDAYITSRATVNIDITQLTYARFGDPVRINVPFNIVQQYNYVRVRNSAQPISGAGYADFPKTFYYFVVDVRYVNPNTTELILQLDAWQTFKDVVVFGRCYVERGHIGIANQNAFDDNGRSYLTIPEGLDTGNEYVIEKSYSHEIASVFRGTPDNTYDIIVVSTTNLSGDPGNVTDPNLKSAVPGTFENLPNGCEIWSFDDYVTFSLAMGVLSEYPWITQGIISVTAVPPLNLPAGSYVDHEFGPVGTTSVIGHFLSTNRVPEQIITLASNWRDDIDLGRYSGLKKFLTYPYTVIELTTYNGTPLLLKPECMPNTDLTMSMRMHVTPPSPRVMIFPMYYNAKTASSDVNDGEFMDMSTGIFDMPTFSVVNNGYMSFMAANAHRIAYSYQSADWSQQKALAGNQLGYAQGNASMQNMGAQTAVGMSQVNQMRDLNNNLATQRGVISALNTGIGAVGQAASGNPAQAASGLASGLMNDFAQYHMATQANTQGAAIGNNASQGRLAANLQYASMVTSSNKTYADYAAKGDYANEIAGINARVQDARLIQPTTSGQIGGDAFNLVTQNWAITAKVKLPQLAARRNIGEYWLRYGYAVNQFIQMPSNFQAMSKFTYWKLRETYLVGNVPEMYRQAIRGIFEKGVTVWAQPSYIGYTDNADNAPLTGITL